MIRAIAVLSLSLIPSLVQAQAPVALQVKPVLLPGAPGMVSMDYLAIDPVNRRLWVPAGNTGKVDVVDLRTLKVTAIDGFHTVKKTSPRGERVVGPSSATVGAGVVYVGNRADSKVCALDATTLAEGPCAQLQSSPDGLAWVKATREVWVTTPRDHSITVLDASGPLSVTKSFHIEGGGDPEGYAVDDARGLFYTNLEDKDQTLAIDVKTRKVVSRWAPGCGKEGPRGLALDAPRRRLYVACTDHLVALELEHGAVTGKVDTGAGVDNIAYSPALHLVYAAAGHAARLTIARADDKGGLVPAFTAVTSESARVVVVDEETGTAYLADSAQGRILVVALPTSPQPAK